METFAFLWALLLWGREIQDGTITIETDSSTVQNNFERMRAENPLNMRLIRAIYHVSVHYRLRIIAKWIPGLSNVLPDLLSRGKMDDFFTAAADWTAATRTPVWTRKDPTNPTLLDHRVKRARLTDAERARPGAT